MLKELERAKIQLLRYISIFCFGTLGTPADAIYHKILLSRHSFLAREAGSDVRIQAWCCRACGRVFHRRAPLNASELTPNVFAFLFGNCNRFLVRNSYCMCFLSKNVHINDGFSSERHLKIWSINFCKFLMWTFRSSVLSSSTSNGILKSLCKILNALFWTRSIWLFDVFPWYIQIKGQ